MSMHVLMSSCASLLLSIATVLVAHAEGSIPRVSKPKAGAPTCEEFVDKGEVRGAPAGMAGMLAMARLGGTLVAAKDCVNKNNVPMACEHWRRLIVVIDRTGPPLTEYRGDIDKLMRHHKC